MNKEEELKKDEEYLDKEFPKGKTKFRGQAMVLLALARNQGRQEERERINKTINELIELGNKEDRTIHIGELKQEINKEKKWIVHIGKIEERIE